MSDAPDLHPETGEPTRIVVGVMSVMTGRNMRVPDDITRPLVNGGTSRTTGRARVIVDLDRARALAQARTGPQVEAGYGRALMDLAAKGGDVAALAKALRSLLALAEGVLSGDPSPDAVVAANGLLTPESVADSAAKYAAGDANAMEPILLAYAVLDLDAARIAGGLS